MLTKTFIAAALTIPTVALSGAAYGGGYQGGPKSAIPLTAASQTFEIKKPYAQYVPGTPASTHKHLYGGGPKTVVPHGR